MFWSHQNVRSIVIDFVQKLLSQSSKKTNQAIFQGNDFALDFGLSSMQLVELAAYTNSFFHFFDTQNPPNLLTDSQLDAWIQKILAVRIEHDKNISFQSSGTSGNSKLITHSIESINREVGFLSGIINQPKRIISFVPTNHIYGFLFTVVLPQLWNIPVIRFVELNSLEFLPDDLIVATPFNWQFIYSSFNSKKIECAGISSGAHLNDQLFEQLVKIGFNITEVFGSTETAGVGYRNKPCKAFELFSYWSFDADAKHLIRKYDQQIFQLQDHVVLQETPYFTVLSRIDQVVQIGGVNISLAAIQEKIQLINSVKNATIYAKANGAGVLIGATIVLIQDNEEIKTSCLAEINRLLDPKEVPSIITFVH